MDIERRLQKERFEKKHTPAKFFVEDFTAFSSYSRNLHNFNLNHNWATYFDVANGLEIPQSLLLGPWTEEMTKFLYWLVKGGAGLDWLTSTSGEVITP